MDLATSVSIGVIGALVTGIGIMVMTSHTRTQKRMDDHDIRISDLSTQLVRVESESTRYKEDILEMKADIKLLLSK